MVIKWQKIQSNKLLVIVFRRLKKKIREILYSFDFSEIWKFHRICFLMLSFTLSSVLGVLSCSAKFLLDINLNFSFYAVHSPIYSLHIYSLNFSFLLLIAFFLYLSVSPVFFSFNGPPIKQHDL